MLRVEERVVLEKADGIGNPLFPDLRVIEYRPERRGSTQPVAGLAVADPFLIETEQEPQTEAFIEIIDAGSGNRVVTIIEVLSPSNKTPGEAMVQYLRKQDDISQSDTSLVEIDLLRGGKHVLAVPLQYIPKTHQTPYMVCVRRAWVRGKAEIYPVPLSQRLPTVRVPLRDGDADVPLDLQAIIERCYRMGRYEGASTIAAMPIRR